MEHPNIFKFFDKKLFFMVKWNTQKSMNLSKMTALSFTFFHGLFYLYKKIKEVQNEKV